MDISSMFMIIEDPRRDIGKKYSLESILFMATAAAIGGADDWYDVEDFVLSKESFFRAHCPNFNGIPSHDTFNRVFSLLPPEGLEKAFRLWIAEICGRYAGVVAIDGKELRGAARERADGSFQPLRMVSAWATENGVSLGQVKVSEKSNEITAIPRLVEALGLEGCLVTVDAIGCQREVIDGIVKAGADFLICVKKNQRKLHATLADWFDGEGGMSRRHMSPLRFQTYVTEERSHGRIDRRECHLYSVAGLGRTLGWKGVRAIVRIRRDATYIKSGRKTSEIRYFITSLEMDVKRAAEAARSHWRIENNLHWQLDVSFAEDADRKRQRAAQNFSLVRKIALTTLKADKTTASIRRKRKRAGWDEDFLKELLTEIPKAVNKQGYI